MAPSVKANRGYWQSDEDAPHCRHCKKGFSWFFRRHHCRSCGYIFCNDCTKKTSPVPQRGLLSPERVCEACFALLRRGSTPQHSTASSLLVPPNGAAAVTCAVSPGTLSSCVESKALGVAGRAAAAGALNTPNNEIHGAGAFGGSTSSSAMAPLVDIQRIASYTPMDDTSDGGDAQLAATNTTITPMTATGDRNPNATTAPSAPLPVPPALRTRTAWADDSDDDDDDSNEDAVGESARHAHTSSSAGASPLPPVATVHTGPVALDAASESDSPGDDDDENDDSDDNEDGGDSETKRQRHRREKGEAGGLDDKDNDDSHHLGPRSTLLVHGIEEEEVHRVRFFDTMIQRVERVDRHSQVAYNQETDTLEFQMEEVEDVSMLFPPLPRSAGNSVRLLMEPIKTRRPGANSVFGLLSSGLATACHSSSNSNSNPAAADVDKLLTLVAEKVSVASPLKPVLTMVNGVPAPENLVYKED